MCRVKRAQVAEFSQFLIRNRYQNRMRKTTTMLTALTALVLTFGSLLTGCSSAPADGKLQVMFSGNIRGNVAPCG